jgi:alpha-tubulin suppressor-like RCC1 family protein
MSDNENSKKILLLVAVVVLGIISFHAFLFPELKKLFISKSPNISEASSKPVESPINNAICNGPVSEQSTINIEPTKAISVVAGDYFTCALTEKGTVRCWGKTTFISRPFGVFVNDTTSKQSNIPIEMPDLTEIAAITAGSGHACVITKGGAVKCSNANLQYGHIQNDGRQPNPGTPY